MQLNFLSLSVLIYSLLEYRIFSEDSIVSVYGNEDNKRGGTKKKGNI
jgi:hypothetical protein